MSELWETIDLTAHGLIEAHAGTGKTYTIVKIVLKLLEQVVTDGKETARFVHIREILLVTYTEKAAGELKQRVRKGLEDRIRELKPDLEKTILVSHLESCLNNLHEACIGTTHAVCLRLLQTWPFESGVHFETQFTDDVDGRTRIMPYLNNSAKLRQKYPDLDTAAQTTLLQVFPDITLDRIALCAPTGRAKAHLVESIGNRLDQPNPEATRNVQRTITAKTVQGLLIQQSDGTYRYNRNNPLFHQVVVVDEASLLDINLFAALLEALPDDCRLILVVVVQSAIRGTHPTSASRHPPQGDGNRIIRKSGFHFRFNSK
ncbi:MAG: UvrD-helicase domain-containing protein [Chitinispirillaceae bacterium]|nr:UvrD-helicase domain-containing protein [Chitinispirillaceae bacterium]